MNITEAKALVLQECQREKKITIRNLVVGAGFGSNSSGFGGTLRTAFCNPICQQPCQLCQRKSAFLLQTYYPIGDSNVVILSCDAHLDCIQ